MNFNTLRRLLFSLTLIFLLANCGGESQPRPPDTPRVSPIPTKIATPETGNQVSASTQTPKSAPTPAPAAASTTASIASPPPPRKSPTPPPQDAPSATKFDPSQYNVECMNPILGSKITEEILFRRTPTTEELEKIAGCLGNQGRNQGDNTSEDRDNQQGRDQSSVVLTSLPTAPPNTLRMVNLPKASHMVSDNPQCEAYEGEECADLRWTRIDGLLTGAITALHVSRTHPNVVYTAVDSNGMSLWKSDDSGTTWKRVYEWAHASDVAVSPSDPSTVLYSELEEGVYLSTDSGTTWETVIGSDDPDWVRSSGLYFKTLAFSIDSPEIAYAVASHERGPTSLPAEVYRSVDGGRTWNHSGTCTQCGSVYDVVVEPGNPTAVWMAGDFGVHVSNDSGESWSDNLIRALSGPENNPPTEAATIGLAINSANPETILAATASSGVYRTTDQGKTWGASNDGLDALKTHQVAFAPSTTNVAWLTTHDGVYRSNDSGEAWVRQDDGWQYTFTNALAIDPQNSNVAYVGTAVELQTAHSNHQNKGIHQGGGLYKTVNGGRSWEQIDQDMEETDIVAMATHPYQPFNLWVGDKAGRGGFVTKDGGDTWLHAVWSASHYPMVFAFTSSVPSKHYLSSALKQGELTVSADGGNTWVSLADGLGTAVDESPRASRLPSETGNYFHVHLHGLAIAPSNPDIIYTGTIYDPSKTEVYSMMGAVIFTSQDGGLTWKESSNGFPIETPTSLNAFVVHPSDPDTAYAMTSGYESTKAIGIYKTTDGGSNWNPVNEGLDTNTRDLQIDPISPDTLYAATGSGVYKTIDGAQSWTRVSDGLPSAGSYSAQEQLLNILRGSGDRRGVFDLAIDPINPLRIYAATTNGVYATKDGGSLWYEVNFGLTISAGNPFWHDRVLEIDATGQVLYVAIGPELNDTRGDTQIYRAIMDPLLPLIYEFDLDGQHLEIESDSYIYDLIYEETARELHFTINGPNGVDGFLSSTIPNSLLVAPFTVTIDRQVIAPSSTDQTLSIGYTHTGRSNAVIKGS